MLFGESLLIFISVYGLGIRLPHEQLWLVLISVAAVNVYTWMRLQTDDQVSELEIFSQIAIDVVAIGSLLYLTGGASNPITWVFLLPLIITAIMLPQSYAWYMVILTTSTYTILITYNIPLPSIEPHMPDPKQMLNLSSIDSQHLMQYAHEMRDRHYYNLHMFGMWLGFVFSAGLVAFFVVELARTLRNQERSLAEARENALRDERVISLGTLAASAAHDMSTPLGTIAIMAHEIKAEYPEHRFPDLQEKMQIMQEQIDRCKQALSLMSASAGEMRAESGRAMAFADYLDNLINQWRTHKPGVKLNFFLNPAVVEGASIIAERTLTHSIINILNNAAEVSPPDRGIELHAAWDLDHTIIKIRDYGVGLPPEIIELGGKQPVISNKLGLGVGLFLAYSTISRLGGKIHFYNLASGGACVEITLPLMNPTHEVIDDTFGNGQATTAFG